MDIFTIQPHKIALIFLDNFSVRSLGKLNYCYKISKTDLYLIFICVNTYDKILKNF